jgi:ribosomal protein RSM22 (predicted rRNA methylase)
MTRVETDLPPELRAGLDSITEHLPRRALAQRASAVSAAYRAGRGSTDAIYTGVSALAYAMARLPATFAATTAALAALADAAPDFAPRTLTDVGAGPGTASWAAAACFPSLAAMRLIDNNDHMNFVAFRLLRFAAVAALRRAQYDFGDARQFLKWITPADLVIASYFIGELPGDELLRCADALWSRTAGVLVVIEPGTPAGFRRIRDVRASLVGQGAHVLCPCPHDLACPLVGDDWCHFAQRLNRSRDHRQVKKAALSFEDEKFSYVVLTRQRPATRRGDRVLAPPRVTKAAITTKLCTPNGVVADVASRRDRDAYKMRKRWRWGDAVDRSAQMNESSE